MRIALRENEFVIVVVTVVVDRLFHQAYVGFRRFCVESENLPADLHIVLSDILQDAGLYISLNCDHLYILMNECFSKN